MNQTSESDGGRPAVRETSALPERYAKFQYGAYHWEGFHAADYKPLMLTKGYFAAVSPAIHEELSMYNWFANVQLDPETGEVLKVYGCRRATDKEFSHGFPRMVYLHRHIQKAVLMGKSVVVDHINGDSLDCRSNNLRLAGHSSNSANKAYAKKSVHTDLPRGVGPVMRVDKATKEKVVKYIGRITVRGKNLRSKAVFSTPKRAHRWYCRAHAVLHPVADAWNGNSSVPELILPPTVEEYLLETIPF